MPADPIRIGIVGYGRMGRLRASVLRSLPDFQLVAICEPEPVEDAECPVYTDYHDLLDAAVDAVCVCTPNYLNAEVTIEALARGKHVFCEKPPARSVAEMVRVVKAERQSSGLKLQFGFNHRYHDAIQEGRALIASGRLGRLLWLRGIYGKSGGKDFERNWRSQPRLSGGGILIDQGIHMLDLFRLFAGEFEEVKSFIGTSFWNMNVEDNAFAILRNRAGQVAMLHSSATHWKHQFTLDLYLSDGYLQVNGILTQSRTYGRETLVMASRGAADSSFAAGRPREEITFYDEDRSWERELADFARAIREGLPIEVGSSGDALRTLELVEKIYEADATWNRVPRASVAMSSGETP